MRRGFPRGTENCRIGQTRCTAQILAGWAWPSATQSGTAAAAEYNKHNIYYVDVSHNDGYINLYAPMTHFVVSAGQTVSQGEVPGILRVRICILRLPAKIAAEPARTSPHTGTVHGGFAYEPPKELQNKQAGLHKQACLGWSKRVPIRTKARRTTEVRLALYWWTQRDSNPRPLGCEPNALPTELWARIADAQRVQANRPLRCCTIIARSDGKCNGEFIELCNQAILAEK